jgi:hypothetical protein
MLAQNSGIFRREIVVSAKIRGLLGHVVIYFTVIISCRPRHTLNHDFTEYARQELEIFWKQNCVYTNSKIVSLAGRQSSLRGKKVKGKLIPGIN